MADKIFVNGMISQEIPDTAPEFILGKMSFKIDDFIAFLEENRKYSVGGWVNVTVLRSKSTQKRYAELDLYQWNKLQETNASREERQASPMTSVQPDGSDPINTDDIPF